MLNKLFIGEVYTHKSAILSGGGSMELRNSSDDQEILQEEKKLRIFLIDNNNRDFRLLILGSSIRSFSDNTEVHKSFKTKPDFCSKKELEESGWYWPGLDSKTSAVLLTGKGVGTFLVRDSSDPRYLYALSVQTKRGPTSVRIDMDKDGMFSLDKTDSRLELPKFQSVVRLITGYCDNDYMKQIWVDRWSGLRHSCVDLKKPLRTDVSSLKHLCRLTVNKCKLNGEGILPTALTTYVKEYPYSL